MERNIISIDSPIDPSAMDDDDVSSLTSGSIPYDASKVVTDVSRDPRGPSFDTGGGGRQPVLQPAQQDFGPQVLVPTGPLIPIAPKNAPVRLARGADQPVMSEEDRQLSEFVSSLGADPSEFGLAVPPAPQTPAPRIQGAAAAPQGADMLGRAQTAALRALCALPAGIEVFIGSGLDQHGVEFVMGLGLLVGRGHAVYRGDGHFRITDAGRQAATGAQK